MMRIKFYTKESDFLYLLNLSVYERIKYNLQTKLSIMSFTAGIFVRKLDMIIINIERIFICSNNFDEFSNKFSKIMEHETLHCCLNKIENFKVKKQEYIIKRIIGEIDG